MQDTIAVDFGTMRTKLSYIDPKRGTVELMRLGQDERPFLPSLFFLGEDGRRLFGDDAAEYLDSDPLAFLPQPLKRELRKQWVRAGNRVKATPTELLTLFFAELRERSKELPPFRDALPVGLSLTIPAQYGPPDRTILANAAHNAGYAEDRINFVDEPIAAAQAWASELGGKEEYVIVLDCGGGTLDWACLHRSSTNTFEIVPELPPSGDNRVGGFDIDEALFAFVDELIGDEEEETRSELQQNRCLVQDQIRAIKEKYSRTGKGGILRVGSSQVEIAPEILAEKIHTQFVSPACQNLDSYLGKCRVQFKLEKPTVLLVGGSARFPVFQKAIAEQCKCNAVWWERSEYATVLGALRQSRGDGQAALCVPAVSRQKPPDTTAMAFIADQKHHHDDFRHFLQEMFLVQWRLTNSVFVSANSCYEVLSTIQDGEDNASISLKVRQGLENVSIADFSQIVDSASSGFVDMVAEILTDLPSRYIQIFPELEGFREKFAPSPEWKKSFAAEVAKDLLSLKHDYETIEGYDNQLAEFYPRYDGILNRAVWLDWLLVNALGLFTGGLEIATAMIWGNWHGMSDEDFMKSYSTAIKSFIDACVKFNEAGERVLASHIQHVNDLWDDAFQPLSELYLVLAQKGENLESVSRKARELELASCFTTTAEDSQFAAAVVANLKQQPYLSKKVFQNIVDNLRGFGLLLTTGGELDEKAVAALPLDEGTKLRTEMVSAMMTHIQQSPACNSDRFHVAPDIPKNKLVNAIKAYGIRCEANDVLALYDDTVWGGGADGFIITLGGVFWTGQHYKAWSDIKRITKTTEGNAVTIDGSSISIAMAWDDLVKPHLADLLKQLRECVLQHIPKQQNQS